ncbi:MAG: hypothetical protein HY363_03410 [Candidatus Aenigmarchaeota archaeon]|nr:hypothetical protein [Candidatus Aenigmarchaeota archaeon]
MRVLITFFIGVFFAGLLVLVPGAQLGGQVFSDGLSYYHLQIAKLFWSDGVVFDYANVFGGRLVVLQPYHVLLAVFAEFFAGALAMSVLNGLLHAFSFVLIAFIMKENVYVRHLGNYFLLLYAISIPVLAGIVSPSPAVFAVFLLLVGTYLFLHGRYWLAGCVFFLLSLHGLFANIVGLAWLLFLCRFQNKSPDLFFFLLVILLFFNFPLYFYAQLPFAEHGSFVAEFGGLSSFSLVVLLLSFIGVLFVWRYKTRIYALYIFLLLLFVLSFYERDVLLFANFFVVFLSAHTVYALTKIKFVTKLKPFFVFFVFAGLFLQPFSFVLRTPELVPAELMADILLAGRSAVTLSSPDIGFLISFWGGVPVSDGLSGYANYDSISRLVSLAFDSGELEQLKTHLNELKVKRILLTPALAKQHPRFAELLTNSETFKSLSRSNGYVLYDYTP